MHETFQILFYGYKKTMKDREQNFTHYQTKKRNKNQFSTV